MILVSSAKGIALDRQMSTGDRPLMYAKKSRGLCMKASHTLQLQ